jgi:hypothetical protein
MDIKPRLIKPISIKPKKPANLKEALDYYDGHIKSVYISYIVLTSDVKNIIEIVQPMQSFELLLKKAFSEDCYQSKELLEFVQELVIVEKEREKLELYYNQIVLNLNKLLNGLIAYETDIKYPITKDLFDPFYFEMMELIHKTSYKKDDNGKWNYDDEYFTSKNLINQIRKDVSDLINDVDNVFTYKEFNKTKKIETNTTPIQKEIEPPKIKWIGKNKSDLAYLFWRLQKEKIISINSFGNDLSKIFIDSNNNKIENKLFNKYTSEFKSGKFPANAIDIDKLIEILKKGIDKV